MFTHCITLSFPHGADKALPLPGQHHRSSGVAGMYIGSAISSLFIVHSVVGQVRDLLDAHIGRSAKICMGINKFGYTFDLAPPPPI